MYFWLWLWFHCYFMTFYDFLWHFVMARTFLDILWHFMTIYDICSHRITIQSKSQVQPRVGLALRLNCDKMWSNFIDCHKMSKIVESQHHSSQHHITLNHLLELLECSICTLVWKDAVKCSVLQHLTASFITQVQMLHSRISFEWLNVMWCWVMWSDVS